MKQGKRPTVKQKEFMTAEGLDCRKYLVTKDTPVLMEVVHRNNGSIKKIQK